MPSTLPPIALTRWHRSWTWGSDAALRIVVVPSASAAAITAFSVPVTDASSRKISVPTRRASERNAYASGVVSM
jgi:hypothetical protein